MSPVVRAGGSSRMAKCGVTCLRRCAAVRARCQGPRSSRCAGHAGAGSVSASCWLTVTALAVFAQILNGPQLMYMPMWDPNAESLVTGPSQDDHDGGPAAGVASGFDPSGGEPCYQFGNQWDP